MTPPDPLDLDAKRYWIEAGVPLLFEKPPNKPHIPRWGQEFVPQQVVKAEDYDALLQRLRAVREELSKHVSGHYDDLRDGIRQLAQAAVSEKDNADKLEAKLRAVEEEREAYKNIITEEMAENVKLFHALGVMPEVEVGDKCSASLVTEGIERLKEDNAALRAGLAWFAMRDWALMLADDYSDALQAFQQKCVDAKRLLATGMKPCTLSPAHSVTDRASEVRADQAEGAPTPPAPSPTACAGCPARSAQAALEAVPLCDLMPDIQVIVRQALAALTDAGAEEHP